MRIELDAVLVPHRKLLLRGAAVRTTRGGIPRPDLVRVEEVQLSRELSAGELVEIADEVPVDVLRMILVLDEGAVRKI
jgi:hypothetical protein